MNKLLELVGKPLYFETFEFNKNTYVSVTLLCEDTSIENFYGDKPYKPLKFTCLKDNDVEELLQLNNELVKVIGFYSDKKFKICSYEILRKKK